MVLAYILPLDTDDSGGQSEADDFTKLFLT